MATTCKPELHTPKRMVPSAILLTLSSVSALLLAPVVTLAPARAPAVRMDFTAVVKAAQVRAVEVKAGQDATAAAMVTGFVGFFALPTTDNILADLFLSTVVAGAIGVVAGFRQDGLGDAARTVGGGDLTATRTWNRQTGVLTCVRLVRCQA